MKVLLILTNNAFWQRTLQSLLIWITTGFLGSIFLSATGFIGLKLYEVMLASLAFSAPAIVCLIPILCFIASTSPRRKRIVASIISVPVLCAVVIAIFLYIVRNVHLSRADLLALLPPYVVAAHLCFFLIAGKTIIAGNES